MASQGSSFIRYYPQIYLVLAFPCSCRSCPIISLQSCSQQLQVCQQVFIRNQTADAKFKNSSCIKYGLYLVVHLTCKIIHLGTKKQTQQQQQKHHNQPTNKKHRHALQDRGFSSENQIQHKRLGAVRKHEVAL